MNRLAEIFLGGLGIGENCIWCLVVIFLFMRLGEAKRGGEGSYHAGQGGRP